jgi:hypothetical protein
MRKQREQQRGIVETTDRKNKLTDSSCIVSIETNKSCADDVQRRKGKVVSIFNE